MGKYEIRINCKRELINTKNMFCSYSFNDVKILF
jgi:hypothetical protein